MMISRMIGKRTPVPNLVVAQRVIDRMTKAAQSYLEDETGEAMVGVMVQSAHSGMPTLYVLDTIAPDASAVRRYATFQQGDERQDEILYWWRENWRSYRALLPTDDPLQSKWNTPLYHLGDWHKQPGFMIHPSGGDLMTALEWISDPENKLGFMLAPIVTLGYPSSSEAPGVSANYQLIPLGDGTAMRVDWWYIDVKSRGFQAVTPTIYPDDSLPTLPDAPWHLTDESRFDLECRRLKEYGLFLSLTLWDTDGKLPLEVCLLSARADWDKIVLLITPSDYPASPPRARIAPLIPMKPEDDLYAIFEQAWAQSIPLDGAPDHWNAERWLIEYMQSIALAKSLPLERLPEPVVPLITDASAQAVDPDPAPVASAPAVDDPPAASAAAPADDAAVQPGEPEKDETES